MVEFQIISKIILTGDYSIITDNYITEEYFKGTGWEEEFAFIQDHVKQYGNVPDKETFIAKFKHLKDKIIEVNESDKYLVDTIREANLFKKAAPVIQKIVDLANEDANAACEYMFQAIKELQPDYRLGGTNIITEATDRLEHYKERVEKQDDWYFSSGFNELDTVMHGIKRKDELIVIFARTNNGKSWVLEKMITHIWKQGFNVGYISPEMSADSVGYRFDTLFGGFSNKSLEWGNTDLDVADYENHLNELKQHQNKFIVATPIDFDRTITVSKLRNWVKQYNLEAIAIDGITYMTDERAKRNDNKTTSLTNISEDLMSLSLELGIPILVVVQANRTGVVDKDSDGTPELESIRDCDGISHNATKVLALRIKDECLEIKLAKQRIGKMGVSFKYLLNLNIGDFIYTEGDERISKEEKQERREKKSGKDVF